MHRSRRGIFSGEDWAGEKGSFHSGISVASQQNIWTHLSRAILILRQPRREIRTIWGLPGQLELAQTFSRFLCIFEGEAVVKFSELFE